jgi:hypothetical protein
MEGDLHAKNDQEGSADDAQVANDLENTPKSLLLKDQKIAHKLKCDQGLRTVTSQETGNKCVGSGLGGGMHYTVVPTWQFSGVVTSRSTKLRIMEIIRAARASE